MRVENEEARQFYEREAARNHWNKRQLERQINTLLFERLLKSRDKDGVLHLANKEQAVEGWRSRSKFLAHCDNSKRLQNHGQEVQGR